MFKKVLPLLLVNTLATTPSTVTHSLTCCGGFVCWNDNGRGLGDAKNGLRKNEESNQA
jgi:hypothetical protein